MSLKFISWLFSLTFKITDHIRDVSDRWDFDEFDLTSVTPFWFSAYGVHGITMLRDREKLRASCYNLTNVFLNLRQQPSYLLDQISFSYLPAATNGHYRWRRMEIDHLLARWPEDNSILRDM